MNKNVQDFCDSVQTSIRECYENTLTMEDAEKLSAKCLDAQLEISKELRNIDLDARMKKSGLKAVKAAVYNDLISKSEKRPTVDQLEHSLNLDSEVSKAQDLLDSGEVDRDELKRYYDVFHEAHVFFRSLAKGAFN